MKRWQDRYTALFGLLMLVAIVGQPVVSALGSLAEHADPARIGPGLGLAAVAYAGYLALVRAVGPVALSAADASWRLLSPLPRRTVLGRTTVVMAAVAILCGLALGVVLLSALGAPDHTLVRLAAALVLGLGATIGGMALGVMGQSSPAWDGWLQALTTAGVAAAILLTVLGSGPGRTVLASVAGAPSWPAAALATAVTAFLVRRAWRELPRVPARAIQAASVRTGRVTQAAVALDPGALTWAAEDAHWRGRTPGSKAWPVTGGWVLGWQELRRLGRRPVRLAVLGLSAGVPALAVLAGAPRL
ncbi:MAG: hypothetical protein HOV86_30405, partial [Thermoactinospora sp.]|nr:hypothetical protein [Thermoactinospora sp.]